MINLTRSAETSRPQSSGLTADFLEREITRVGASHAELRTALDFVIGDPDPDPRAYEALSPRMRRLVDLVAVGGHGLSQKLYESPQMTSAA